ncbi:hypothetical protein AURDEDRAFT_116819 [Auricularia subglabra TFB-10046 SS5]|uniref:Uncharacterized protein n=1 Tax=Auricularia subglabra (strain TFB-10046 / SS5) TaxID=717982 RepID=J0WVS8_AURST|nr:hypothetical protein AURDEDRAFT_116819 [Auricularia subglabra TFB-10046 SS5]
MRTIPAPERVPTLLPTNPGPALPPRAPRRAYRTSRVSGRISTASTSSLLNWVMLTTFVFLKAAFETHFYVYWIFESTSLNICVTTCQNIGLDA